ncbi:MAG: endolytic transglycosylase MltG [Acidobacteriota bacterium]|nr:MAG: endolytic transglycosylase MltG [Acidobacteriota bacterium]
MEIIKKIKPGIPLVILISILSLSVALAGTGLWLFYEINRTHEHAAAGRIITVEQGSNTRAIINKLHAEGVLAGTWPTYFWMRVLSRSRSFKAGDYSFKSPISPRQVIDKLLRGDVATLNFTIPEGYNRFDIARVLSDLKGLRKEPPTSPEKLEPLFKNTSLIADLDPAADSLEGYLFPDTYEYTSNSTREQLIETMVRRFRGVFNESLQQRAEEMGLTTRQVTTLASLIEKEARVDGERELISSVFHQRLKIGMPLACDPTVIYAALLAGRYRGKIYQSDLDRDSPYNTYKNPGLPPGPIASPGLRSIESALNPAQTDYLFFVVDAEKNDGSHRFSSTLADHEKAVRVLRQSEQSSGR